MARHYMQVMVGNEVMEIPAPAVDITSGTDRFSTSGQYLSGGAYVRRSRFGARHVEVSWNNLNSQDVHLLHKFEEAVIANDNQFMFVDPFGHGNIMPQWLSNHNMKILPGGGFVKGYSLVPVSSMVQHYEVPENTSGHYDFFIPTGYVGHLWADTLYGTLDYTVDDLPVGTGLTLGAGPHRLGVGESGNPTSVTNLFPNPDFAATSGEVVVWENKYPDPRLTSRGSAASGSTVDRIPGGGVVVTKVADGSSEGFNFALTIDLDGEYTVSVETDAHQIAVWDQDWKDLGVITEVDPVTGRLFRTYDLSDVTYLRLRLSTSSLEKGEQRFLDKVQISKAPVSVGYFDGDSPSPDPDLEARWEGTSNNSTTELVGKRVAGISTNNDNVVVIRSTQWSKQGDYSARILNVTGDIGSAYYATGGSGETLVGYSYLEEEITRADGSQFPDFGFIYQNPENRTVLDNSPGEQLMRAIRGELTDSWVRIPSPGGFGESIWFDLLTVTETENYDGPPFSGETTYAPVASATWTGVPNNSPSLLTLHGGGLGGVWCKLVPQGQNPAPLEKLPGRGVSELSFTGEGIDIVQHSAALDLQTAAATWLETGWWK